MSRYRDLADSLRARIGAEFAVGDRLPAISAVQAEYGIRGLNTVRDALRLLADEGLIRTEHGRGSFVTALPAPRSPIDGPRSDAIVVEGLTSRQRRVLAARAETRGESVSGYVQHLLAQHVATPTVSEVLERAARHTERAVASSVEALERERGVRERPLGHGAS